MKINRHEVETMHTSVTATPHQADSLELLTSIEAAKVLRMSERKLRNLTKQGLIRMVRLGGSVRYQPGDLKAYVENCMAERVA